MVEHALAWARRGFRVFPLLPGKKKPAMRGWIDAATTDEALIRKAWAIADYNIGVLTDDMLVVDIDTKNGKPGLLSFFELGLPEDTLTVRTPTGGLHRYYRSKSVRGTPGFEPGIDLRSHHNYVVAPGSVVEAGAYALELDTAPADLPEAFVERLDTPHRREEQAPTVELDLDVSLERAAQWVGSYAPLAVEGDSGNTTTFRVAAQLKDFGVSEEAALDLMLDDWNERCSPPWEPEELQAVIANAFTYGTRRPGVESPAYELDGVDMPAVEHQPRRKYRWLRGGCALPVDQNWLYYQRLSYTGTALLVAPTNAGKTFLLLDLARSLATGAPFFGIEPDDKAATIILAAEGSEPGWRSRMHRFEGLPVSLMFVPPLTDARTVNEVSAEIEEEAAYLRETFGLRLGLLGLDTIAASHLLLDEDNNNECAKAVKSLDLWAQRFNCLVIATHHPPKGKTGARGGSALPAGMDTVIEIFYDGGPVRFVECTKGRDAPVGKWGSFTLPPITLGFDSRGREITTCEFSTSDASRPAAGKEPAHYEKFMECFDFARIELDLGKNDPVSREALRRAFGQRVTFKGGTSGATKAFNACVQWGESSHRLTFVGDAILDIQPEIEAVS